MFDVKEFTKPTLDKDNKHVLYYGMFPQSVIINPSIELIKAGENYQEDECFEYDGSLYLKKKCNLNYDCEFNVFKDYTRMEIGKIYYFKVEKIKWNIVGNKNGYLTLDCATVLGRAPIGKNTTNYKNSGIRKWLNTDFLSFFITPIDKYIVKTIVDKALGIEDYVFVGDCYDYTGNWYWDNYAHASPSWPKQASDYALLLDVKRDWDEYNYGYDGHYCLEEKTFDFNSNYTTREIADNKIDTISSGGGVSTENLSNYPIADISPTIRIRYTLPYEIFFYDIKDENKGY